ncbi:MAG: alpha/beta fold hydrolase [Promethearchaeota archaeon]
MKIFNFKTISGLKINGKYIIFPQNSNRYTKAAFDVIFLHAFPLDSDMYIDNFKDTKFIRALNKIALKKGRIRLYLPDLPGFGESDLLNSKPKDLSFYVDVVNEIVDHFQIKRFILGGCSMGGYIALEYLRNNTDFIEGLVLIDTKPSADDEEKIQNRLDTIEIIDKSLETYSEDENLNIKMEKLYEQDDKIKIFLDSLHSNVTSLYCRRNNPEIAKEILTLMKKQRALGIIHALNGIAGRKDTSNVLKILNINTLILVGENDTITPLETAKEMKDIISNSILEIIPLAGHLSNMENLIEFNQKLLNWLQITFN